MAGLSSCASTGSPSGGPKDVSPPIQDTIMSTKNYQKNFKPRQVEFHFNEFVEVKDASKQVLVSPPLTYIPQVKHRGKKVTFTFDEKEILRDNATYTINFGDAIVDFHEGNKLTNFTFVFATGDQLDSLSLEGSVKSALNQEPEVDMVVFLYDHIVDSVVAKEKPFYFAKVDKTGKFTFTNIKSDTFRLFAIKDENLNYLYDLETEKIAFGDSLIILTESMKENFPLIASLPEPPLKIMTTGTKTYGKINILFNKPPGDIQYRVSDPAIMMSSVQVLDSLNLYYHTMADSFYLYIHNDTIKVKPKGRDDFLKKTVMKRTFAGNPTQFLPKDSIVIGFNYPIERIDYEKIRLSDAIGQLEDVNYTISTSKKNLIVKYDWLAGEKYTLSVDSQIVRSIYGVVNDSFGLSFTVLKPEQMASMKVRITDLDSSKSYIIKILKDKTEIYKTKASRVSLTDLVLKNLVPERYNLEIVEDINSNGKWDSGNLWLRQQPERIKLIKGDKLRENWESDFTVSWITGSMAGGEPNTGQSGLQNSTTQKPKKE
ncbi:MAG: Ig-like domain-containing protein [Saprospiraceae bacterium]|nr:Ig-like domain-containing protein [Saprospiraceae bacterium]